VFDQRVAAQLPSATLRITLRNGDHGVQAQGLGTLLLLRDQAGIQTQHASRLRLMLASLSIAEQPGEMGLPSYNLHPLKGDRRGTWAVRVSGNWRVTFRFEGPDATDVNYEDYH